jgi:hypothetical protein
VIDRTGIGAAALLGTLTNQRCGVADDRRARITGRRTSP